MSTVVIGCSGVLHQVLHSRERSLPAGSGMYRQAVPRTRGAYVYCVYGGSKIAATLLLATFQRINQCS